MFVSANSDPVSVSGPSSGIDDDNVNDDLDAFPFDPNESADTDEDGIGKQ